ncbi:hypothetical protein V8C86DRAFT_2801469 [Haematococcus lacustris]
MSATLPAGWESAWDSNHSRAYYYNASLGLTQWEPPPAAVVTRMDQPHAHAGLAAAHTQPHVLSAQPDAQPHNHSAKTDTSQADAGTALPQPITVAAQAGQAEAQADWYYRDPVGQVQGPFTVAELRSWRPHLPMDLTVWCQPSQLLSSSEADKVAASGQQEHPNTGQLLQRVQEQQQGQQDQGEAQEGGALHAGGHGGASHDRMEAGQKMAAAAATAIAGGPASQQLPTLTGMGVSAKSQECEAQTGGVPGNSSILSQCAHKDGNGAEHAARCDGDKRHGTQGQPLQVVELAELLGDQVLLLDWRTHMQALYPGSMQPHPHSHPHLQIQSHSGHTDNPGHAGNSAQSSSMVACDVAAPTHAVAAAAASGGGEASASLPTLPPTSSSSAAAAGCRAPPGAGPSHPRPMAPPAPVWERWLLYGPSQHRAADAVTHRPSSAAGAGSGHAGGGQGSEACGWTVGDANAYADAVLAGLPETDEAVVIARLANQSGKSLQEVVHFNYLAAGQATGDAWATNAEYNPRRKRLQLAGTEDSAPEALYGELSRWCDPRSLEASLQAAAARRGAPLPPAVWKELKERKLAAKKRARTQALLG